MCVWGRIETIGEKQFPFKHKILSKKKKKDSFTKLVLISKLHPYWLAFIVFGGIIHGNKGEV